MRLARLLPLLAVLACLGCSASSEWDPAATASLQGISAAMLADIDAGNFDAMMAMMDKDPTILDFDEKGAPIQARGMVEVRAMFDGLRTAMKEQGLSFKSTLVRNDCYATATVGYCVIEFDQTTTTGGQTMGPYKFRGTLVVRKIGNDWKMTHWHGSFREMPAMPADSAAEQPKS